MGLALAVAGCSALPAPGPPAPTINQAEQKDPKPPYVVVKIDEKVTNITGQYRPDSFSSLFKVTDRVPQVRLANGDKISVNIFEAGADGLFSSATAKATQIQAEVGQNGQIFVPYVGPLLAAGRTPDALRGSIENALADKAIQPQVQVSVSESLANTVTVVGDVAQPGRLPIAVAGTTVLDAIAAAGGSSAKPYETRVVLRRGTEVASADLEDLVDDPAQNVPVRAGDVLFIGDATRSFTVMGAAMAPLEYKFEDRRVTLAEGLARAGGVNPETGDPAQVFVFRFEPAEIAKAVDERAVTAPDGTKVPVIYRLNMKDPKSMFLAQLFELRDEDMIYVAQSVSVPISQFFDLIAPLLQTGTTVVGVASAIQNFDN